MRILNGEVSIVISKAPAIMVFNREKKKMLGRSDLTLLNHHSYFMDRQQLKVDPANSSK